LLAIGNFDGVHRGHQYLVRHVVSQSLAAGLKPVVLTFEPHPSLILSQSPKEKLTGLKRKLELLRGISESLDVRVERFDSALANRTPREFVEEVLIRRHGARQVVVGANFRFGHRRAGDLETLRQLGTELGFTAQAADLLQAAEEPISSSRVREALHRGDLAIATELLGRPHTLRGVVVRGEQLGRQLGFPTANLDQVEEMLPAHGVYAVRVKLADQSELRDAVANIGNRPTVQGRVVTIEAHLLDFSSDLYGQEVELQLVERVRSERRFEDLSALRAQIERDVARARELLRA
jgi:riboflavin kinase/FMN adenylyltransferase